MVKLWYMKVALTPAIHLGKPLSSASKKAASIPLTLFVWHEDPLTHLVKLTVCLISEDEAVIVIQRVEPYLIICRWWNEQQKAKYALRIAKFHLGNAKNAINNHLDWNRSLIKYVDKGFIFVSFRKMKVVFVLNSNSKSFSHFFRNDVIVSHNSKEVVSQNPLFGQPYSKPGAS